jgi:hypothetical protein
VDDLKRCYFNLFADAERRIVNDRVWDQLREAAAEMCRLENVLENTAKVDPGDLVCEDRHCSIAKIEGPDVVEAEDVIDVAMRYQYGIELSNICSQRLLAKVA